MKLFRASLPFGYKGFTLAELLSALAILGVIATFTIPKVLNATTNGQWNSIAKETASIFSASLEAYRLENGVTGSTTIADLTPYMNYVRTDTGGAFTIDSRYGGTGTGVCDGTNACLQLHNGAVIRYGVTRCFFGTGDLNAILVTMDPDGKVTGDSTDANGPGKKIQYYVFANGRITSGQHIPPNTLEGLPACAGTATRNPGDWTDPDWFSW